MSFKKRKRMDLIECPPIRSHLLLSTYQKLLNIQGNWGSMDVYSQDVVIKS